MIFKIENDLREFSFPTKRHNTVKQHNQKKMECEYLYTLAMKLIERRIEH